MEIKESEQIERLQSSGYRRLFECVKQEGIEPVKSFIDEIQSHKYEKHNTITQAVLYGKNDLLSLVKKHKDVRNYLREHEKDLRFLSLVNKNVFNVISSLSEDISCLELYLENAKRLEDLQISKIDIVDFFSLDMNRIEIFRNNCGQIISITKRYTDGEMKYVGRETDISNFSDCKCSRISYSFDDNAATFRLTAQNDDRGNKFKSIEIKGFDFAGDNLPSKEVIESYDVPSQLIRK